MELLTGAPAIFEASRPAEASAPPGADVDEAAAPQDLIGCESAGLLAGLVAEEIEMLNRVILACLASVGFFVGGCGGGGHDSSSGPDPGPDPKPAVVAPK